MVNEIAIEKREHSVALETAHMQEQREHYKWILGLAKGFYDSGMCPEGVQSAAQAAQIMLIGEAYELHPAVALQQIGCFKGRVVMPSALMVGLVRRKGLGTFQYEDGDGWVKVTATRAETGETFTSTWNRERVERSGVNKGPKGVKFTWQSFEIEMMRHKAEAEACRALFQDLLMGVYAPEELPDEPPAPAQPTTSRTEGIKAALGVVAEPPQAEREPAADEPQPERAAFEVSELEDIERKPKAGDPKRVAAYEVCVGGVPTHTIYAHQISGELSCSCGTADCAHIRQAKEVCDGV